VHPIFTAVSFGAKLYVHIPKDARAGARGRGSNPAANRAEACIAIGPRSAGGHMPLLLTDRDTRKASRTTLFAPPGCPLGVLSESPPVLPASAATHVDAAIMALQEAAARAKRVKVVRRAANTMPTSYDEPIIPRPGPQIDRAKPCVNQRCRSLVGQTVASAVQSMFSAADGRFVRYRRADLEWDLDRGYLVAKSTTVQFAAHQLPVGFARGRPIVAHPAAAIADNHADMSSAAAGVYAAGNATMDILALSYVCSEAGIAFSQRLTLQIDNAAAQSFASRTSYAGKSRLRHVDARQEWIQALRDSNLVKTVHVATSENISDMFTKALPLATFLGFRKQLMPVHSTAITA
jgi:hypothetical protein